MGQLAINDRLLNQVTAEAKARGVSPTTLVESLLATSLRGAVHRADLKARLKAVAAMTPQGVAQTDSVVLVRQDRDS
ncbi:hypothetical protein [Bosea vaviloviae]|uniref:CopG family transcriptional regulator n=1 Tax=Bosea vaviloviae TaxID=1526658 RepID=A0A1D7TXB1_9HYPH|nr:hypothetical protein [Bosea vaviloviae]AOO79761.1 hypothetical protein BHK69_04030 [Bosea vaviloviae]